MTDVRLTATNPEDSSVVPVACNSRGELLVTEPVIEEIPNDVTIGGSLKTSPPDDLNESNNPSFLSVHGPNKTTLGGLCHHTAYSVHLLANGYRNSANEWTSYEVGGSTAATVLELRTSGANFNFRCADEWPTGSDFNPPLVFRINSSGPSARRFTLRPDGLEKSGAVIDVGEELQFLRAQVQALMEKLRMTPEGGWPVWDGSD